MPRGDKNTLIWIKGRPAPCRHGPSLASFACAVGALSSARIDSNQGERHGHGENSNADLHMGGIAVAQGHSIDKFCTDLRARLAEIEERKSALTARFAGDAHEARQGVQAQVEKLREHVERQRSKIAAAQARAGRWIEEREKASKEKFAERKAKREVSKLESRAEDAELYAVDATDVALASVEDAEIAAMEAVLARLDADAAHAKPQK